MTDKLNDNDLKVIHGLINVVAERGEDWRYPNGYVNDAPVRNFTPDPDWVGADVGGCYNLLPDGTGACIIGCTAVDQGLPTERSSTAETDAHNWGVTRPVLYAMKSAQTVQDRGYTWGVAQHEFFVTLGAYGFTPEVLATEYGIEVPASVKGAVK